MYLYVRQTVLYFNENSVVFQQSAKEGYWISVKKAASESLQPLSNKYPLRLAVEYKSLLFPQHITNN